MENQVRVAQWVADTFNIPVQVPTITDGQDEYPESHDTISIISSSGSVQVNEITSTTQES